MESARKADRLRDVIEKLEACRSVLAELEAATASAKVEEAIRHARRLIPPW